MELIGIICTVLFIVFIMFFCGCWCCKRKREGTVYGFGPATQVTISSQPIHASPVVNPPYPVDPRHPLPNAGAPSPGFHPPTASPYPPQSAPGFYYPPQMPVMGPYPGASPGQTAAYPPASYPPAPYPPGGAYPPGGSYAPPQHQQQPPPYDVAVGQGPGPVAPGLHQEGYVKQAPYNPHYQG